MRVIILNILLSFMIVLPSFADNYNDAQNEVNLCLTQYVNNPTNIYVLEDVTQRIETVNKRVKVTLSGERDIFTQPYEMKTTDLNGFIGLSAITSLFLKYFQSLPYKPSLNRFTLDDLNEVNRILQGLLTIEKINLKMGNLEFWEISLGNSKWCYVHNLSKTNMYTFVVKSRGSTFEGGVMPNSLRVVSNNFNQEPYLRPVSVQITSESRFNLVLP